MSALALFKKSSKFVTPEGHEPKQVWRPYEGVLTRTVDGKIHEYTRSVDLFAICPARNGKLTSIGLNSLVIASNGDITVDVPKGNFDSSEGGVRRAMWPAARVGQTINRSVNDRRINLFRLRSAALCLRGSLQYAPAKKTARNSRGKALVPKPVSNLGSSIVWSATPK